MMAMITSAGKSTGSKSPCVSSGRFSASASARRCLPNNCGAPVAPHPEGRVEVGYYPIRPTRAGHVLCRTGRTVSITGMARASNCLPACELLAEGDDFPVQAFQSGNAFGLQFHPDVTYAMMHRWTTRGCVRMDRRAPGRVIFTSKIVPCATSPNAHG